MKKNCHTSILNYLMFASFVLCSMQTHAVAVQDMAPDFTLKSLQGSNLRLKEYRGQVVLLNFWASWCGPCRQEMPLLDRIHQRYQEAGFAVVSINVEGDQVPARALAQETGVTFPVLIDINQKVSELYELEAMPSSVLVDRDGVVRYIHHGYQPGDETQYLKVIKQLITE